MADERTHEAALGLGGNLGDVAGSLIEALRRLAEAPGTRLARVSSVYRAPPWGKLDQPSFLNMAALIETKAPARALLALCLDIERAMGRRRLERWGPRTIDIDILTYGDKPIDEPDLKVPHPRLCERAFALAPLAEIAPRLSVGGREIAQWLALSDRAGVEIDPQASAAVRGAVAASAARPLRRGDGRSEAG